MNPYFIQNIYIKIIPYNSKVTSIKIGLKYLIDIRFYVF